MPKLTISIINYKTKEITAKCLNSILNKNWQVNYQIFLIDNASKDGSVEYFKKKYPGVALIESDKNLGFAGGHNLVLRNLSSDYVLILNSDIEVLEGLDEILDYMDKSDFDIVGCKLLNKDKSFQPNGGDLPTPIATFVWISGLDDILLGINEKLPSFHRKFADYYREGSQLGWVGGTAMFIKKKVVDKIGYLDDNIFMYCEDVDFCMRAQRAGFRVGWSDRAVMIHSGGASASDPNFQQWVGEYRGLLYIYKKYYGNLISFFLKNLILVFSTFRMMAFILKGKPRISKTYAKVLLSI